MHDDVVFGILKYLGGRRRPAIGAGELYGGLGFFLGGLGHVSTTFRRFSACGWNAWHTGTDTCPIVCPGVFLPFGFEEASRKAKNNNREAVAGLYSILPDFSPGRLVGGRDEGA